MRILPALLIACCLFVSPSLAQQDFAQLEIVIGGGGVVHSFSGLTDDVSSDDEWGGQAGLTLRIGSPFYIEPGIGGAVSVYTFTATVEGFEEEDVLGHLAVRIPLQVGYKFPPESPVKARFFAGLAPAFIVQVEEDNDFEVTKDDYESTVWNATFGAGVDLLFLTADIFYEPGLTSLFVEGDGVDEPEDVKLSGFGGRLGLRIAL